MRRVRVVGSRTARGQPTTSSPRSLCVSGARNPLPQVLMELTPSELHILDGQQAQGCFWSGAHTVSDDPSCASRQQECAEHPQHNVQSNNPTATEVTTPKTTLKPPLCCLLAAVLCCLLQCMSLRSTTGPTCSRSLTTAAAYPQTCTSGKTSTGVYVCGEGLGGSWRWAVGACLLIAHQPVLVNSQPASEARHLRGTSTWCTGTRHV